jgi:hypothetical protein
MDFRLTANDDDPDWINPREAAALIQRLGGLAGWQRITAIFAGYAEDVRRFKAEQEVGPCAS